MKSNSFFSKKALTIMAAFVLLLAITFFAVLLNQGASSAKNVAQGYFSNIQAGNYQKSMDMVYMKEENSPYRKMILRAYGNDKLLSYQVGGIERLSEQLYLVNSTIETSINGKRKAENYVAQINGEWKFVINKRDVPSEIYSFSDMPEDNIVFQN